jgi:hypothetical protein
MEESGFALCGEVRLDSIRPVSTEIADTFADTREAAPLGWTVREPRVAQL